jgi:ADP-ribose pyrophosphatase YjhB (NUDIX family)
MVWKPHVTVAAVIEHDGKFLVVEEIADQQAVYNQPAGHLEEGETFVDAIIREVQEETAWQFIPDAITGIYRWRKPEEGKTFVRACFTGTLGEHDPAQKLDEGIIAAAWLTRDELLALPASRLRSPMVKLCLEDYLAGKRYPLDMISEL